MLQLFKEILNLEGHPNRITGSTVTAILLNGWILPIGGSSAVEGLRSRGLPRLVSVGIGRAYSNGWKHWIASTCKLLLSKICLDDCL